MAQSTSGAAGDDQRQAYLIRVRGHITPDWADWFGGMEVTRTPEGESVLRGEVPDQAALHGILATIRNLGLPLIEVVPARTKD